MITDGVDSVTKRISIHVSRTDEDTDSGSDISTDFTQFDRITDLSDVAAEPARVEITFLNAGFVLADKDHGFVTNFPQTWNVLSPTVPDPQNFEIRLTVVSGHAPTGGIIDQWLNLSSDKEWSLFVNQFDTIWELL